MAHGASVNCLALGHKSGRVLVTGGDDKKVNLWAVGKPNCIMVSLIYFLLRNKKGHRERGKTYITDDKPAGQWQYLVVFVPIFFVKHLESQFASYVPSLNLHSFACFHC